MISSPRRRHLEGVDQYLQTATMDNDDAGDRPTLPGLPERPRFDATTEHFFSSVATLPELAMDAAFIAKLAEASASIDDEASAWWAEQRRSTHVRLVAVLLAASVALLFAGALR